MNSMNATAPGQGESRQPADPGRLNDEFLGLLAHELRNPLAPIVTAASILQRPDLDGASVRRIGALIQRQASHMTALLSDLLDVSRINMGLVQLRREAQDLHEILAHAIEQAKPLMELRSQRFSMCAPPRALRIEGDANRLVQVFANILNNAAKYTPEGGGIVLAVEPSGAQVVVRVTDTGIGMSEALLPHIFENFTQAERSADRHVGGLGLGLSLVKNLVALQGGTVVARSAGLGHGSEFTVAFPLLDEPLPPEAAQSPAPGLAAPLSLKIMVVAPQVFILDRGRPGTDGHALARQIRPPP